MATNFKIYSEMTPTMCSENTCKITLEQSVILLEIEILKFDRSIISWRSFCDMLKSLVHENNVYSNIERFYYLVSYIFGPALIVVKIVSLTTKNYVIVWNTLQEWYENQRLLVTAHVEKLFAFVTLQGESVASFSLLVNTFRENLAAIETLSVTDLVGFLLFYIDSRVIDPATVWFFEASIDQRQTLDLQDTTKIHLTAM